MSQLALKLIPQHERAPREYSSKHSSPMRNGTPPESYAVKLCACALAVAPSDEPNAHTGLTHEECRSSRTRKPVSVVYLICVLSGQGSAVAGGWAREARNITFGILP